MRFLLNVFDGYILLKLHSDSLLYGDNVMLTKRCDISWINNSVILEGFAGQWEMIQAMCHSYDSVVFEFTWSHSFILSLLLIFWFSVSSITNSANNIFFAGSVMWELVSKCVLGLWWEKCLCNCVLELKGWRRNGTGSSFALHGLCVFWLSSLSGTGSQRGLLYSLLCIVARLSGELVNPSL